MGRACRHRHDADVGSFDVLDGEVTFFLGEPDGVRAGAGAFVHVPPGVVHGFRISSETARYLIVTTPRHGDFYRAVTPPSRPGRLPQLESVDGGRIEQACRDYGIEFVGPLPGEG